MTKQLLKLMVVFVALQITINLSARDVYVSTSAQLAGACTNALQGDVIKISAGNYDGPFLLVGKSGVTLQSNGGTVYLRGSSSTSTNGIDILYIENSSNITVNGLKFTRNWGISAEGIVVRGSGNAITIKNCEFYDIGWGNSKTTLPISSQNAHAIVVIGTNSTPYTNIEISNNIIRDCITGYSESLTVGGNVDGFIIDNNIIYSNTNIGIDCMGHFSWTGAPASVNYARNGVVRENKVFDYAGPASLDAAGGIYIDGGSNITVENNIVYNYKVGFSIGCETPGKTNNNNILRNNIAYNCSLSGLFIGSNQANSSVNNTKITGNTFYKCGFGTYDNGQIALQNNLGTVLKNNILYPVNNRYAIVQMGGTGSTTLNVAYNLYYRDNGVTTNLFLNVSADNNPVKQNPLFVDAVSGNFSLQTASPAINAGDPLYSALYDDYDIDGQPRVQSGRVDIGADEFAGSQQSITIDGNLTDWLLVQPIVTATNQTCTSLKVFNDNSFIYFGIAGTGMHATNYHVFIDADNNSSTGFQNPAFTQSGADYMIENGRLYQSTGTGWSWALVSASITVSKNTSVTELKVPLSVFNQFAGTVKVAFTDINSSWSLVSKLGYATYSKLKNASIINRIDNSIINSEINVYPNPANSFININLNQLPGEANINIFSTDGRLVYSNKTFNNNCSISLLGLSTGNMAIVVVEKNGVIYRNKVVIW